jgi:hypothetical protein
MIPTMMKVIRKLKGGSQPYLMHASDGNDYIVKFQNNPQGTGVLLNELLSARLLAGLNLSVPEVQVLRLEHPLDRELSFESPTGRLPIHTGLHLGSKRVMNSLQGRCYDYLPRSASHLLRNQTEFGGITLFDSWTCNRDVRQAVYWKSSYSKKYTATFIDNGHCFGGPDHRFHGSSLPIGSLFNQYSVFSWTEWWNRIESYRFWKTKPRLLQEIPPEWCGGSFALIDELFDVLADRQAALRSPQFHESAAAGVWRGLQERSRSATNVA